MPNGGALNPGVRGAIARAAQASGMDFSYLLGQARLESGLNPSARAATSSASGLYQFTDATWAQTLARHGAALGIDATALTDPASRAQLMGLRNDPQASALMAAAMAGDNQAALTSALGRPPGASELYLAHFLGADGAVKFLSGLAADGTQSAAALLPRAASANRAVFFDNSGAPRSLAQVMGLLGTRLASAMRDDAGQASGADGGRADWTGLASMGAGLPGAFAPGAAPARPDPSLPPMSPGGPIAREFAAAAAQTSGASGGWGGSMADTLRATFGADTANPSAPPGGKNGATPPDFIRTAYGRMQALGL